jgi:hypothetical protein
MIENSGLAKCKKCKAKRIFKPTPEATLYRAYPDHKVWATAPKHMALGEDYLDGDKYFPEEE